MAKEAADIVILDDNFSSIVKSGAVGPLRVWQHPQVPAVPADRERRRAGAGVHVPAVTNGETPLNVLQLLWVNLIMDALGALGAPLQHCSFVGCYSRRCQA